MPGTAEIGFRSILLPEPIPELAPCRWRVVFHTKLRRRLLTWPNLPERIEHKPLAAESIAHLVAENVLSVLSFHMLKKRLHRLVRQFAIVLGSEGRMARLAEHSRWAAIIPHRDVTRKCLAPPV